MEGPNPIRFIDGRGRQLPKVFIVYPHNPQPYVWIPPPSEEDIRCKYPGTISISQEQVQQIQLDEARRHVEEEKARIRSHDELVHKFAEFLRSNLIAVSYEGLLLDHPVSNYTKWFQAQMADSDFILLVITDSFKLFLSGNPPPPEGKERLFMGEFLHVLIHNPSKPLLPIFLNRPKDPNLLPDTLRACTTYQVMARDYPPHFDVQSPQLDSLYAFLTGQDRITPPLPVSFRPDISNLRSRRRDGPVGPVRDQQRYTSLRQKNRTVTNEDVLELSGRPEFSKHWKSLAESFHFPLPEIERIGYFRDDRERCYQLLCKWVEREGKKGTVSLLAEGLRQNSVMLEIACSVLK